MQRQEFNELKALTKSSLSYAEGQKLLGIGLGKRVLELGTYTGLSTYLLAKASITVDTVDDFRYYDGDDFSSIEEVKKINKEILSRCDNVKLHEWDIDRWFLAGFCKADYYDMVFIDSGDKRSVHMRWCKCAGIKTIIVHDFKFENRIFEDGLLDWRGDIIYGVWSMQDAIERFTVDDTLITLHLK